MVVIAITFNVNATESIKVNNKVEQITTKKSILLTTNKRASRLVSNDRYGIYLVSLTENNAPKASGSWINAHSGLIAAKNAAQQEDLLTAIRHLDSSAVLTRQAHLSDNALYIQLKHRVAKLLTNNVNVAKVELLVEESS